MTGQERAGKSVGKLLTPVKSFLHSNRARAQSPVGADRVLSQALLLLFYTSFLSVILLLQVTYNPSPLPSPPPPACVKYEEKSGLAQSREAT